MEYNSQREQMKINDYGRNVVKLIEYAKGIDDRQERTKVAEAIVDVMSAVNPQVRQTADYKRRLWDHLMIMSDWSLDVDAPYEMVRPEATVERPRNLAYKSGNMKYRHYGATLEKMVKRVAEMPEGEERNVLTEEIAHAMKRDYLTWNRDTVEDEIIAAQLDDLSEKKLSLPETFEFHKEYAIEKADRQDKVKKKKKKKN